MKFKPPEGCTCLSTSHGSVSFPDGAAAEVPPEMIPAALAAGFTHAENEQTSPETAPALQGEAEDMRDGSEPGTDHEARLKGGKLDRPPEGYPIGSDPLAESGGRKRRKV